MTEEFCLVSATHQWQSGTGVTAPDRGKRQSGGGTKVDRHILNEEKVWNYIQTTARPKKDFVLKWEIFQGFNQWLELSYRWQIVTTGDCYHLQMVECFPFRVMCVLWDIGASVEFLSFSVWCLVICGFICFKKCKLQNPERAWLFESNADFGSLRRVYLSWSGLQRIHGIMKSVSSLPCLFILYTGVCGDDLLPYLSCGCSF